MTETLIAILATVLAIGGVVWLSKWMTGAKRRVAKNRRQSPRRRTSRRVSA